MPPRRSLLATGLALLLASCVSPPEATRDGGTPCTTTDDCNPDGQRCGAIYLCVTRFCSATTIIRACSDGSYPDALPLPGDCFDYQDCNPPPACGSVVGCVGNRCDTSGPRVDMPCSDGGVGDAPADVPGATDAAADGAGGAGG
jgi:hypothetical protein